MKLFIYNEKAKLTQHALRQIRKAGYLPIQMSSVAYPDVKALDLEHTPIKLDAITRAAFRSIQAYGTTNSGSFQSVRAMFAHYVCEEMLK